MLETSHSRGKTATTMEGHERDESSESDSDVTRILESEHDSGDESTDEAPSDAPLGIVRDPILAAGTSGIVDAAEDDNSEAEFVILPPPRVALDEESDSDTTLAHTLRKRKRIRRGDDKKTVDDLIKPESSIKPTVVIKPQATECTVCYDPCTISGRHRLVSLKCGHVFGKRCIDRWVLERKTCPNCSVAVRKADIRPLFTDHVAVVDNSGLEDMTQKFEAEKSRRIQVETELSRAKLQLQLAQNQAKQFQEEAERWRKQVADLQYRAASERFTGSTMPIPTTPSQSMMGTSAGSPFHTHASGPVPMPPPTLFPASQLSQSGGGFISQSFTSTPPRVSRPFASQPSPPVVPVVSDSHPGYREVFQYALQSSRVCAFASSCSIICVGEALSSTSFAIVKLSTADSRHAVRIPAHSSVVRDISISPLDDLVLSVAWDGKAVVSSLRSDSVVMQCQFPPNRRNAWSCTFSAVDPFVFFCGFHDGTVAQYDMRRQTVSGGSIVALYELPVRQPVHSIQVCPTMASGHEQLIAGTFAGFGLWGSDKLRNSVGSGASTSVSSFHAVANCCAVSKSQTKPSRLIVTTRSQPPSVPAKHNIFDVPTVIGATTDPVLRSSIQGFRTPQVMSRAAIWEDRDGTTMVASWDDEHKRVSVWDESTKQVKTQLAIGGQAVVDIQHAIANGEWQRSKPLLGVLSPQCLVVYTGTE